MSASVDQRGVALLEDPIANNGTAFDVEERRALGLDALDGRTRPHRHRSPFGLNDKTGGGRAVEQRLPSGRRGHPGNSPAAGDRHASLLSQRGVTPHYE